MINYIDTQILELVERVYRNGFIGRKLLVFYKHRIIFYAFNTFFNFVIIIIIIIIIIITILICVIHEVL